ncbi:hypothetical protein [Haladaptatus sp. DJG-WS-42]|uniref:DUF7283 family protein n=1 Tax=Haladaptatus sp. DJG-WS-42 TaxID=3120516 RepID=UPI0030CC0BF8
MFDLPAESVYIWLGVSVVSVAVLGVTLSLPTAAPAATGPLTTSIDRVAASPYNATGEHPLSAERIKLGSQRVAVKTGDTVTHGTFAYGPITPVSRGTALWRVLQGAPPRKVFDNATSFKQACLEAREAPATWRPAPTRLTMRKLTWEGVNATLVSA